MAGRDLHINRDDYESLLRQHVRNPYNWGHEVGTDYWMHASANGGLSASTTFLISDAGWTATSLALADGAAADFMTASDVGTPGGFTQNAQNDLLKSPAIFGDYAHAHAAMTLLQRKTLPRYLIGDFYARFSVVSGNETTTALGFVEDGGSIVTANDAMAVVFSNSATFAIRSGAATGTGVVAVDTSPHRFRIVFDRVGALAYLYVDGVASGSVAIQADEWPVAFGAGSGGATNFIQLTQAHIFYAYRIPQEA
jgi:hypothetical protein